VAGFEIWHFPVANVAPVEAKATIAAIDIRLDLVLNRAGAGSPGLFTPKWTAGGGVLCLPECQPRPSDPGLPQRRFRLLTQDTAEPQRLRHRYRFLGRDLEHAPSRRHWPVPQRHDHHTAVAH